MAIVEFSFQVSLSVALDDYGSKTRLMCAVKELHHLGDMLFYSCEINVKNTSGCVVYSVAFKLNFASVDKSDH